MPKSIAIIVINYNNYLDTLRAVENLHSFLGEGDHIFLLENCSKNDSALQIIEWANSSPKVKIYHKKEDFSENINKVDLKNLTTTIITSDENLGFSRGCNFVISKIVDRFDYILLFNNDAFCINNVPQILLEKLELHSDFGAATCRINDYQSDEIQQVGGALTWYGHFKRYGIKQIEREAKEEFLRVTFASGCILMLKSELLVKYGLLSELIFFGEEDFELSHRYKRLQIKMMAVHTAVAEHKGGASQKTINSRTGLSAYATSMIGRAVALKGIYSYPRWALWLILFNSAMFFNIAYRRGYGIRDAKIVYLKVFQYAFKLSSVSQMSYHSIISEFK